jgi:serine/threonine protein kinase
VASGANVVRREFSSKDLRTVGNYTLGRLIGKGSFGKVYLASHKLTNGSKVGHVMRTKKSRHTDQLAGGTQIVQQGRHQSCSRDPSSSPILTSSYRAAIRSGGDRKPRLAGVGVLSRYVGLRIADETRGNILTIVCSRR